MSDSNGRKIKVRPSWLPDNKEEGLLTPVNNCPDPPQRLIREEWIGVDEVGRGSLAGDLTTCAVWLNSEWDGDTAEEDRCLRLIKDSKLFGSSSKSLLTLRKQLCDFLVEKACESSPNVLYSMSFISVEDINVTKNILSSTKKGWIRDVTNVEEQLRARFPNEEVKVRVIIDGDRIPDELMEAMSSRFTVECQVKADEFCKPVSAASILAKQHRDEYLIHMDKEYPQYGFARHKGYGTELHTRKLLEHGKSLVHRYFDIPDPSRFKKKKTVKKSKTEKETKRIVMDDDNDMASIDSSKVKKSKIKLELELETSQAHKAPILCMDEEEDDLRLAQRAIVTVKKE